MTRHVVGIQALAVAALPALAALAYANAFAGQFYLDDYPAILQDTRLSSASAFFASMSEGIRPVTRTTYFVDRLLYGSDPAGYHVMNLLVHIASGLLVYAILVRPAMRTWTDRGAADRHRRVAWWTAALFLLHPIATEAVTYISGRPTSLMTCAYLGAFLLWLEVRTAEPCTRRRLLAVAGMLGSFAIALASKEAAVVFPGLVLLYEGVIGRHVWGAGRVPVRVLLALVAVGAALAVLVLLTRDRYVFLLQRSLTLRGVEDNLLTQAGVVVFALSLFVRPWRMNFDHDLPAASSILDVPTLVSVGTILALIGVAVVLARLAPLVSFGLLWFFLHLLPTQSVLARDDLLSERNLYLPSIGIYLALVGGVAEMARSAVFRWRGDAQSGVRHPRARRVVVWAAGALVIATLMGSAWRRNALYADPAAFWSDAVQKSPRKARPHTNLGIAWIRVSELDRAIAEFRIALSLDPLDPVAQRGLLEAWKLSNPTLNSPR